MQFKMKSEIQVGVTTTAAIYKLVPCMYVNIPLGVVVGGGDDDDDVK